MILLRPVSPVLAVLSWLFCLGSPVMTVLFWLFFLDFPVIVTSSGCPVSV
jgi:hypothetical protein